MKAAHWLGFGTENVRVIPTNDRGQMVTSELEAALQQELELGRHPVMVNATAGTTVLGAIDDLERVAAICEKYGVWMHVDVSKSLPSFLPVLLGFTNLFYVSIK